MVEYSNVGRTLDAEQRFGRNPDVDSPADVIDQGGDQLFPESPGLVTVVSDSPEDSATGIGAQSIMVWFTVADGCLFATPQPVVMNGTTPVEVYDGGLWIGLARCFGYGSSRTNLGRISVLVDGEVVASMPPGFGQTQCAAVVLPTRWRRGFLRKWYAGFIPAAVVNRGEFALMLQETGEEGFSVRRSMGVRNGKACIETFDVRERIHLSVGTKVKVRCLDVAIPNAVIYGGFDVELLPAPEAGQEG